MFIHTFIGEIDRGNCLSNGYTPALLSFLLVYNLNGGIMAKRIEYKRGELIRECVYLYDINPYNSPQGKKTRRALFVCKCGNEFESAINKVKFGETRSCGCARKKHGIYGTKIYRRWASMLSRCYTESYPGYDRYGGRGIKVYGGWMEDPVAYGIYISLLPDAFRVGYTIDRIDNDGNYEPDNLRWASRHVQGTNTRKREDNTSGYTGVFKNKRRFTARLTLNGHDHNLGTYDSIGEAVNARNKYIVGNNLMEYKIQHHEEA